CFFSLLEPALKPVDSRQHPETAQYGLFVELANRSLDYVRSLKITGLREASTRDILFRVNHKKRTEGISKGNRLPDIVVVPLASARRVHGKPTGDWKECSENEGTNRGCFGWPDVLVCGEVTLREESQQPDVYHTDSESTAASTSSCQDGSKFTLITSASNSIAASGSSISPLSTRSGSTHVSVSSVPEVRAGLPRGLKRPGNHNDQSSSKRSTSDKTRMGDPDKSASESNRQYQPNQSLSGESKANTSNNGAKEHMLEAALQLGINAAEMLRCSLGRRHAFGMIIIDAMLWIWWFDRQGAIQSSGINFIEDLPRFMVLLFAIQRFDLDDWGFDEALDPSVALRHSSPDIPTTQTVEYEVDGKDGKIKVRFSSKIEKPLHEVFSLKGRCTHVFPVAGTPEQPPLVAKLYWPNQDRPHEAEIIDHARENLDLVDHLPDVFGRLDIDPMGTRRIRDELGISSNSPGRPRLLRIIIMEELSPIIKLRGDDLIIAWAECVRCHYLLSEKNIRHLDLSLANLMVREREFEGKPKYFGVVNDWDLGDMENNLLEARGELTKTILFTALDILKPRPANEQVVQRYSHDLESFAWILVWVFLAVQESKVAPVSDVVEWQTGDPESSLNARVTFTVMPSVFKPHEEWQRYWMMARRIAEWLRGRIPAPPPIQDEEDNDEMTVSNQNAPFDENQVPNQDDTPEERKELLWSLLEMVKKRLGDRMPSLPHIEGL
ncbi:unnamed protein product, partial [Rhizoctonia solani]